ncbi:MAG: tetratricopeptide repeat protein [Kiritimatiellae bacterium]|nr:tetratricopeptide repeat protein [Kiritimatiellia bacterium]
MRQAFSRRWLAAAFLLAAAGGCRTVSTPAVVGNPEGPALAPLSAEGEVQASALAFYSRGLLDERRRDYVSALSNFQAAARLDPANEELVLRVALLLLQQRRVDEAVGVMEESCRVLPDSDKILRWTILVNRAAEHTDRVIELYRDLIRREPADADPYVELTALLVQDKRIDEAIRLLESGRRIVSEPLDLLRLLAGLHAEKAEASTDKREAEDARRAAIRALESAREKAPEDTSILFQLGDLYIADRQIERAVEYFEAVEQEAPDSLAVRQKLAFSFLKLGDKAIETLEKLTRDIPGHPRLFFYLGELYHEKGDAEKALLNFGLAEKAFPDDPTPILRKALILTEDLKQPEAAARTLLEGLETKPEEGPLLEMLAYVYYDMKDYARALELFQRRHELSVKKEGAPGALFYFNFALTSEAADRVDEAAQHLRRAVKLNPAYLQAYLHHAFEQDGNETVARCVRVLEKLARLQPKDPDVYYYTALLQSSRKAYPEALAAFEKAEEFAEDSPFLGRAPDAKFFFWYGAAAERNGEFDRAVKLLEQCLQLDPEYADAYNYLAYMWAEKGTQLDRAEEYVKKALAANPASAAYIDTLGWIYYMRGEYAKALEQLSQAAELLPEDPTILDHLGDALHKLGREDEALPRWQRSFVLDPDNESVAGKLRQRGVELAPLRAEAEVLKKEQKDPPDEPSQE